MRGMDESVLGDKDFYCTYNRKRKSKVNKSADIYKRQWQTKSYAFHLQAGLLLSIKHQHLGKTHKDIRAHMTNIKFYYTHNLTKCFNLLVC